MRALRLLPALLLGLTACSDVADDPAPPSGPAAKVHPDGWLADGNDRFHGEAIRAAGWSMTECQSCHGADYAGGIVDVTCLTCHSRTPESCSTCHGTSGVSAAPPEDLLGNTSPAALGVGAHTPHLQALITEAMSCGDCHAFAGYDDPAHIDGDGRAEVVFGERAKLGGAQPTYDPTTGSCANTYCHGGGQFGLDAPVVWNDVSGTAGDCGSCHGAPPAADTGHSSAAANIPCDVCHGDVVDVDDDDPSVLRIIDIALHINGASD